MIQETENNNRLEKCPTVRPYHTPRLLAYGKVRELTQGGAGSKQEGALMIAPMRFP